MEWSLEEEDTEVEVAGKPPQVVGRGCSCLVEAELASWWLVEVVVLASVLLEPGEVERQVATMAPISNTLALVYGTHGHRQNYHLRVFTKTTS